MVKCLKYLYTTVELYNKGLRTPNSFLRTSLSPCPNLRYWDLYWRNIYLTFNTSFSLTFVSFLKLIKWIRIIKKYYCIYLNHTMSWFDMQTHVLKVHPYHCKLVGYLPFSWLNDILLWHMPHLFCPFTCWWFPYLGYCD